MRGAAVKQNPGTPPNVKCEPVPRGRSRDPKKRLPKGNPEEMREKMLDKTLADSFPTSDPPSSIPNPSGDDSVAAEELDEAV